MSDLGAMADIPTSVPIDAPAEQEALAAVNETVPVYSGLACVPPTLMFWKVIVGLAIGIAASFVATRVLSTYLYATRATDPVTLVAVCVAFIAAGAASFVAPAWRATAVDPLLGSIVTLPLI